MPVVPHLVKKFPTYYINQKFVPKFKRPFPILSQINPVRFLVLDDTFLYYYVIQMWCWRRMEKISWIDHVRNEDVLLRVKEQRNILQEIRNGRRTG
jgi:hypothetical protein